MQFWSTIRDLARFPEKGTNGLLSGLEALRGSAKAQQELQPIQPEGERRISSLRSCLAVNGLLSGSVRERKVASVGRPTTDLLEPETQHDLPSFSISSPCCWRRLRLEEHVLVEECESPQHDGTHQHTHTK